MEMGNIFVVRDWIPVWDEAGSTPARRRMYPPAQQQAWLQGPHPPAPFPPWGGGSPSAQGEGENKCLVAVDGPHPKPMSRLDAGALTPRPLSRLGGREPFPQGEGETQGGAGGAARGLSRRPAVPGALTPNPSPGGRGALTSLSQEPFPLSRGSPSGRGGEGAGAARAPCSLRLMESCSPRRPHPPTPFPPWGAGALPLRERGSSLWWESVVLFSPVCGASSLVSSFRPGGSPITRIGTRAAGRTR